MFGADAHAYKPRRNAAQDRKYCEQPQRQRNFEMNVFSQDAVDDAVLDQNLRPVGCTRGKVAPLLYRAQMNVSR
jgi:hypothetical protein